MKNLRVECENPAIILNPHLKEYILRYRIYHTPTGEVRLTDDIIASWFIQFPYGTFRKIKKHLTHDELSEYYVTDMYGDKQLLFLEVPCGKCLLCREKKANEWVSRGMAETQSSTNVPYFITLTYNDKCLPRNGVRKRACQLFMKRLRINISRHTGEICNIRFFLCSEYGSRYHRPHYHAILWNVPNLDSSWEIHNKMLQDIVQRSWSFMVSKKRYDEISDERDKFGTLIYKYHDTDNNRYRAIYGYTVCSECNEHRVRYCMKYMRKDCDIPTRVDTSTGEIKPMNDVFFLSSRRRGIGYQWITEHVNEYRDNPQLLDVTLTDKFTGEIYRGSLPRYFKDIIAPTRSRVIPKEYRDAFDEYNNLYYKVERYMPLAETYHQRVIEHYPSLYYHHNRLPKIQSDVLSDEIIRDIVYKCDELEYYLLSLEYDKDILQFVPQYKHDHMKAVEQFAMRQTETIPDKVARIKRNRQHARELEKL